MLGCGRSVLLLRSIGTCVEYDDSQGGVSIMRNTFALAVLFVACTETIGAEPFTSADRRVVTLSLESKDSLWPTRLSGALVGAFVPVILLALLLKKE